jgi:hypothetical protein
MPSTALNFSMGYSQIRIHKQTHELIENLMILRQSLNSKDGTTGYP